MMGRCLAGRKRTEISFPGSSLSTLVRKSPPPPRVLVMQRKHFFFRTVIHRHADIEPWISPYVRFPQCFS